MAASKKTKGTKKTSGKGASSKEVTINLPNMLDIAGAEDFYQEIKDAIKKGGSLLLNAKAVERITTPCVQIVISAGLAIEETGNEIKIENVSDGFKQAFSDLGFDDQLSKWSLAT